MLSEQMHAALNTHMGHETYSARLYESMACDFAASGLGGIAHWMTCQALEELGHAARFRRHILDRGRPVRLPHEWSTPMEAFQAALEHEQKVTEHIHGLMGLAGGEDDYATKCFWHWFVGEQVEEEAQVTEIIQRLGMHGPNMATGISMLNMHLAERPYPTVHDILGMAEPAS